MAQLALPPCAYARAPTNCRTSCTPRDTRRTRAVVPPCARACVASVCRGSCWSHRTSHTCGPKPALPRKCRGGASDIVATPWPSRDTCTHAPPTCLQRTRAEAASTNSARPEPLPEAALSVALRCARPSAHARPYVCKRVTFWCDGCDFFGSFVASCTVCRRGRFSQLMCHRPAVLFSAFTVPTARSSRAGAWRRVTVMVHGRLRIQARGSARGRIRGGCGCVRGTARARRCHPTSVFSHAARADVCRSGYRERRV